MRVQRGQEPSRLAAWRVLSGKTQKEMADATGISLPTYRRLERGELRNPPLRYLMNCALALGCDVQALFEDEWWEWYVFDERRPQRPDPDVFLKSRFIDLDPARDE